MSNFQLHKCDSACIAKAQNINILVENNRLFTYPGDWAYPFPLPLLVAQNLFFYVYTLPMVYRW